MSNSSPSVTVRFALTKGEGGVPDASLFSAEEKQCPAKWLELVINYDPDGISEEPPPNITSVEILYDGVTPIEGEDFGYRFDDEGLNGYPAPVIRFTLDKEVDLDEFRVSIFESYYQILTQQMQEDDEEPFLAEDHNGYASIVPDEELGELVNWLKANNAFCGKSFQFPDGLPIGGHSIEGREFLPS